MYCLICVMLEITLDVLQLKDIIVTLTCIDLMMNCIVGLKILLLKQSIKQIL